MRIDRAAFGVLAVLAILSTYTLGVASMRFGDATETFDGVEFELVDFTFERGLSDVVFTMAVENGGGNPLQINGLEYSYVVNGVLSGGGDDLEIRSTIAPGETVELVLDGRITDTSYVDRQPEDEPLEWLVRGRILINVDERLDSTWVVFAFRTETD